MNNIIKNIDLENEYNNKMYYSKELIKKYININHNDFNDAFDILKDDINHNDFNDAFDILKDDINYMICEYNSLDIQVVNTNKNYCNIFNDGNSEIILSNFNYIDDFIKSLELNIEFTSIDNKEEFKKELKEILQNIEYSLNTDFEVEECDEIYSELRGLESIYNDNLDIYELLFEFLNNNLQKYYNIKNIEARGYSQGNYDKYIIVIKKDLNNKEKIKEFLTLIKKPLKSIFTCNKLQIEIKEKYLIKYYNKNKKYTSENEEEIIVDIYSYFIYGNETGKIIKENIQNEYKDYTINFNF